MNFHRRIRFMRTIHSRDCQWIMSSPISQVKRQYSEIEWTTQSQYGARRVGAVEYGYWDYWRTIRKWRRNGTYQRFVLYKISFLLYCESRGGIVFWLVTSQAGDRELKSRPVSPILSLITFQIWWRKILCVMKPTRTFKVIQCEVPNPNYTRVEWKEAGILYRLERIWW